MEVKPSAHTVRVKKTGRGEFRGPSTHAYFLMLYSDCFALPVFPVVAL